MAKRGTARDGRVIMRSERAFQDAPECAGHTEQGDMIFKDKGKAREYAQRVADETGRKIIVDPDGGIPHGEELGDMMRRERAAHEERLRREKVEASDRRWAEFRRKWGGS